MICNLKNFGEIWINLYLVTPFYTFLYLSDRLNLLKLMECPQESLCDVLVTAVRNEMRQAQHLQGVK